MGGSYNICKFATVKKTEIFQKCRQNFLSISRMCIFLFFQTICQKYANWEKERDAKQP